MCTYHVQIKSGRPGTAIDRSRYIARENKYSRDESENDLVAEGSGNLPEWAPNADDFWKAADRYERRNGAVHRDLEISLPNELTLAENISLVDDLLKAVALSKPFQYAIHCPSAALSQVPQPHVHIMMNDRKSDGIKRPPELHFKRHNPKKPELGGCKKDSGGKSPVQIREDLKEVRKTVAGLINIHLERAGRAERVDHRSNAERGLTTKPAKRLSPAAVQREKVLRQMQPSP